MFSIIENQSNNSCVSASVFSLTLLFALQAKEAELQQINKVLEDSSLTASKYRQWKHQNEEIVLEIEKLTTLGSSKGGDDAAVQREPAEEVALETVATETAATETADTETAASETADTETAATETADTETADTETRGAYSLSEGEQLVDAEASDVLLEIPPESPSTDTSSVLELSLGSLQDSINQELSELMDSGEAAENYFYI